MKNLIAALAASLAAHSTLATGYNNESAWRSVAGPHRIETFESFGDLTEHSGFSSLSVTFGFLDDGIHYPYVMAASTCGGVSVSGTKVLVNNNRPALPGLGTIRMFPAAGYVFTAVGYWNTGGDDSSELRFYNAAGTLIESQNTGTNALVFNGIVNVAGAAYVEFDEGGVGNGFFSIDDLQVVQAPEYCLQVLTQPESIVVCEEAPATMGIGVSGVPPYYYQWRRNDTILSDGGGILGATSATLTIGDTSALDTGLYDCVVTNACGSITSNTAALDVFCNCAQAVFLGGIDDTFHAPAETASPSVALDAALNHPLIDFDQVPGVGGVPTERFVAHTFTGFPRSISSATLTFRAKAGAGGEGTHTDRVRLGFADSGGLNTRWGRYFGYYGGEDGIVFTTPRQWEEGDTAEITLDLANLPRADGTSVSILPELATRGLLDFLVTDDSGVDYALLTITGSDGKVVSWLGRQPQDVAACPGSAATLSVTTGGVGGPFTYQWRKNGAPLTDDGRISGATTATLSFASAVGTDAGSYDCVVTGANWCAPGVITSGSATLSICPADFDCDSFVTGADFDGYVEDFESGGAGADFDGDGFVTGQDFDLFVQAFEQGC